MAECRLIINADDFGYCPERNRGIVECLKAGAVTSFSILVNCEFAEQGMRMIQTDVLPCKLPNEIPAGLHLNLTEGKPVETTSLVSSLLGNNGFMRGKDKFYEACKRNEIICDEVRREIRAQIERFYQLVGCYPNHVDGHQHVHVIPEICDILVDELHKYGISRVRLPLELELLNKHSQMVDGAYKNSLFFKTVSDNAARCAPIFKLNNIRFPDGFVGISTMSQFSSVHNIESAISSMYARAKHLSHPFICELMVHPGYRAISGAGTCPGIPDSFAQSSDREHEVRVLKSAEMKAMLERHQIVLTSFLDL